MTRAASVTIPLWLWSLHPWWKGGAFYDLLPASPLFKGNLRPIHYSAETKGAMVLKLIDVMESTVSSGTQAIGTSGDVPRHQVQYHRWRADDLPGRYDNLTGHVDVF